MVRRQEELPYLRRRRQDEVVPMCVAVSVCLCLYPFMPVDISVRRLCACIYLPPVGLSVCLRGYVCIAVSVGLCVHVLCVEQVTEASPQPESPLLLSCWENFLSPSHPSWEGVDRAPG